MIARDGYEPRRAWRLVGVFAPWSVIASVIASLVVVVGQEWGVWVAGGVLLVAAAVAGWTLSRGESPTARAFTTLAVVAVSSVATFLVLFGVGPAVSVFVGGVFPDALAYVIIGVPWAVLVVGGTLAARAGRYEGAARVTIWWIVAVGASGFVAPLVVWLASVGLGDDLTLLLLYFVPGLAMGMWLGPLGVVGGRSFAVRRGAAPQGGAADVATADLPRPEGVSAR